MIIDIHAHAYPERIAKKVKERMESVSGSQVENLGTPEALVEEMEKNGVDHSVFLPVAPILVKWENSMPRRSAGWRNMEAEDWFLSQRFIQIPRNLKW